MARYRLRTVGDLVRNRYWLRVSCACGHAVKIDPARLLEKRGIVPLDQLEGRLRCSVCGGRDVDYTPCYAPDDLAAGDAE